MVEPVRTPITWEEFQIYLDPSIPGVHRIPGEPPADLFVDSGGKRIGLRIPVQQDDTIAPIQLTEVDSEIVTIAGIKHLQISTTSRGLFRDFLTFAQSVADQVQLEGLSPITAVFKTLEGWRDLLSASSLMSEERQVGLWGELWVLERLMIKLGHNAVSAWTGPARELHDFRVGNQEFEVKTTRGQRRVHMINGLDQLTPSPGHALYLVSIRIEIGGEGSGVSLANRVEQIRGNIPQPSTPRSLFESRLDQTGYRDEDSHAYDTQYQLGDQVMVVTIDDRFPKISRAHLDSVLGDHSHRIDDVRYRVDVQGMGIPTSSSEFSDWFPPEGTS